MLGDGFQSVLPVRVQRHGVAVQPGRHPPPQRRALPLAGPHVVPTPQAGAVRPLISEGAAHTLLLCLIHSLVCAGSDHRREYPGPRHQPGAAGAPAQPPGHQVTSRVDSDAGLVFGSREAYGLKEAGLLTLNYPRAERPGRLPDDHLVPVGLPNMWTTFKVRTVMVFH